MAAALDKLIQDLLENAECRQWDLSSDVGITEKQMIQKSVDGMNATVGNLDSSIYDCPICKNKGIVFMVEERNGEYYESAKACQCKNVRRDLTNIRNSGIEPAFRKCSFDNFEASEDWQKAFLRKAISFSKMANADKNEHKCFYVGGNSGIGKTHICTAITKEIILCGGKEARYMLWVHDVAAIKTVINTPEYEGKLDEYRKVPVLYIDDFFKSEKDSRPTAADVRLAYEIINYRYQNTQMITIISSERYINEIIEIDEAVGSRIAEMCGEYILSIAGARCRNYRLRNMQVA